MVFDGLKRVTLSSRIDEIAIRQAAAYELKRYGDDAIGFAARHAERLSGLGDIEGSSAWIRISRAIEALRRESPAADETVGRNDRPAHAGDGHAMSDGVEQALRSSQ